MNRETVSVSGMLPPVSSSVVKFVFMGKVPLYKITIKNVLRLIYNFISKFVKTLSCARLDVVPWSDHSHQSMVKCSIVNRHTVMLTVTLWCRLGQFIKKLKCRWKMMCGTLYSQVTSYNIVVPAHLANGRVNVWWSRSARILGIPTHTHCAQTPTNGGGTPTAV
jgi:hypothetical protein